MKSPAPSRRLLQALRWLVAGVFGLWLCWLLVVNAILALHAIPAFINSRNPVVTLDYGRAWSLWPGTVHLRDFRLRGHDRQHLEFSFAVDRAYAVIALRPLLGRTFRATHVEVSGVDARFRMLYDATERARARQELPLLPPIAGFPDPPMQQFGPEELPVDLAHDVYWTVDLEDVHLTHVTQLWVQSYRLQLDGSSQGRFGIHPTREFDLGPASLDIAQGRVSIGEDVVATDVHGSASSEVRRIPLREVHGLEFLHFIDGAISATGQVPSLAFVKELDPDVTVAGGAGPLRVQAAIDHGVLLPSTHIEFDGAAAVLSTPGAVITAPLHLDLRVEGAPAAPRVTTQLRLAPVHVAVRSIHDARVEAADAELHVVSKNLDLAAPFDAAELRLDAAGLELELAPWLAELPALMRVESGRARGELHLELRAPASTGHGKLHLVVPSMSARLAQREVRGTCELSVAIDHFNLDEKSLELAGTQIAWVSTGTPSGNTDAPGWWFRAELDRGSLDFHGAPAVEATAHATARDGRPVLEQLAALGSIPRAVDSALTLQNLDVRARARLTRGTLTLSPVRVAGGSSELLATARIHEGLDAVMLVRSGPLSTGVVISRGHLQVQMLGAEDRFKQSLDANAPVALLKPELKPRRPRPLPR